MTKDEQNIMHRIVKTLDELINVVGEIKKDVDKIKKENKKPVSLNNFNSKTSKKISKKEDIKNDNQFWKDLKNSLIKMSFYG